MSDKIINFFTIVAWVLGIISTLICGGAIYLNITYEGSEEYWRDKLNGKSRTYKFGPYLIIAILCWAFIIAF